MSEQQTENNIDTLFQKGIEPLSTEPSDEFWRNAAEGIILRNNLSNGKEGMHAISTWRAIAFVLAGALLAMGYFAYRMQKGLINVEQQVAIQKDELKMVKNEEQNSGELKMENSNGRLKMENSSAASHLISNFHSPLPITNFNPLLSVSNFHPPLLISNFHSPLKGKPAESVAQQENGNQPLVADVEQGLLSGAEISRNRDVEQSRKTGSQSLLVPINLIPLTFAQADPENDELKIVSANPQVPLAHTRTHAHFSLSMFFAPDFIAGYNLESSAPGYSYSGGSEYTNAINAIKKETQNFSYTAGAKAEEQLSSHFSIGTGIGYEVFSFNSNPGNIYAQKETDGDVGYYFTTSSGVVDCPYYGATKVGDSLKMNASSTRTYLQIPLSLKYFFTRNGKYKLYVNGGIETNLSLGEKTTMNWQDYWWDQGTATVNNTQGSSSIYFSYYLGIGADYKIGKYLSAYLEPGMHNAITSLDNNTPVVSYPRLFSVTAGLTYSFN